MELIKNLLDNSYKKEELTKLSIFQGNTELDLSTYNPEKIYHLLTSYHRRLTLAIEAKFGRKNAIFYLIVLEDCYRRLSSDSWKQKPYIYIAKNPSQITGNGILYTLSENKQKID